MLSMYTIESLMTAYDSHVYLTLHLCTVIFRKLRFKGRNRKPCCSMIGLLL